jgi:Cytochrome c554 and c-prime
VALAVFLGTISGVGEVARPATPPDYSVTCATCHHAVVSDYAHAPMRNAMQLTYSNPPLEALPKLEFKRQGFNYQVVNVGGKITYRVSDGTRLLSLPILWTMGMRTQTWVIEQDGRFYESMVTFFPKLQGLDTTPGFESVSPHSLQEAIGPELSVWEVSECANCHATGVKPGVGLSHQQLTPGLNCERCHLGAAEHLAGVLRGKIEKPDALDQMNAGQTAAFCGQCHRRWDDVVRNGWTGPPTVRFQPYRLENSKCFNALDKRIGCVACHDPHQPVRRGAAFYDTKCLACHAATAVSSPASSLPPKICHVGSKNCSSCHMPKVELPTTHAFFTDHQIRVVKPNEPYPN